MASSTWHKVFGALAAAATAISSAGPAMAQAAAHGHDAATPHQLSLDRGRKWVTDDALRNGMDRIRGLVEPRLGDAHAGKLTATQYRELATQIETEVGGIVANCKLEPKADAMLHMVIGEIGAGTDAMAGRAPGVRSSSGLVKVATAVNDYARYFDHAGFQVIAMPH